MKIQRKMYEANEALSYFVTHNWDFKNDNFINLSSLLRSEDHKDFDFRDLFTWDLTLLGRNTMLGQRRHILKEKDESLPKCRQKFLLIEKINQAIKLIPLMVFLYYVLFKFNLIENVKEYFDLN